MSHSVRRQSPVPAAAIVVVGIGLAIALGLMVAADAGLLLLAVLGVAALVPLMYFVARQFTDRTGWLLVAGTVIMLFANASQVVLQTPVGYLQELLLFGLTIVIVRQLWLRLAFDRTLRALLLLWLVYILFSLLSTALGRSHLLPALWQMQYNLKWPLMFGLGLLLVWGDRPETRLRQLIALTWILLAAAVALEIAAPGLHTQIFGPSPDTHPNSVLGVGLRYRGFFPHSGYLAIISGFFSAAALAQTLSGRGRLWLLVAGVYAALVLLSGQRQELLALVLSILLLLLIHFKRYWYLVLAAAIGLLVIGTVVVLSLGEIPMRETLEQSGLLASTQPYSERATLTFQGVSIAQQFFPLGSGLGTYGGVGAMKFDQSLFLEQGFMRYWWFRQGLFLVDTFWPGVIAESGFFGAIALVALFFVLWLALVKRALARPAPQTYALVLTAIAALTLLLANSPTSGSLTDPRSSFIFWLMIGAAWRATSNEGHRKRKARSRLTRLKPDVH